MESCPFCGAEIIHGAMRCPKCRKILKTKEEQLESFERYKKDQKKPFPLGRIIRVIIFIAIALYIAGGYKEEILTFIEELLTKHDLP